MFRRSIVLAVLVVCVIAPAADASRHRPRPNGSGQSTQVATFGRMFPQLKAFTDPTTQELADLAQSMLDPGTPDLDNPGLVSGFTYFGQFIDHDITRDESPPPTGPVDPTKLQNFRTPALDLDSVYGGGPQVSPQLYDGAKLKVSTTPEGVPDLPRNPDGSAIIGDNRNDENMILAQLHAAFLRFHNHLVDDGASFATAQRLTILHYQYLVLHDYLPAIVGADRMRSLMRGIGTSTNGGRRHSRAVAGPFKIPVEFSTAAFRFGHSEVRPSYGLSTATDGNPVTVFSLDGSRDLHGGRPIPAGMGIEWTYFFNIHGVFDEEGNLSRLFDTKLSQSLFQLPIPGAEATGSNVLAFRSLTRAAAYGLPSGQDVARALHLPVITPQELALGPGFERGTPLWFYVLAEAERRENGLRLGPVGATIVGKTLLNILAQTPGSILQRRWNPTVPHTDGPFSFGDLLLYAGVVPPDELEPEADGA